MDEARGLSFGIAIKAITEQAEEGIHKLMGMLGTLRAEAAGGIDFNADTEQAEENIRELAGNIGNIGEHSEDIDIAVNTEQAQADVQKLSDRVINFGQDPPDIKIGADTSEAERSLRNLTNYTGEVSEGAGSIGTAFRKSFLAGVDSGNSFASSLRSGVDGAITHVGESITGLKENVVNKMTDIGDNLVSGADRIGSAFAHPIATIRNGFSGAIGSAKEKVINLAASFGKAGEQAKNFSGDADSLRQTISKQESQLEQLKQSYVNLALSESTSSEEAKNLAAQIGSLGSELQDNRTRLKNAEDAADQLGDSLADVGGSAGGARPDIENLGDAAEKSGGKFEKLGDILKGVGKTVAVGLTAATVAVGGFAAASVNTGMSFDSSMSQVAATMGMTTRDIAENVDGAGDTFSMLREKALEMGSATKFTSQEAAEGLNILAMSGYNATDSVGMIEDVLHLAAAGSMDMASSAGYISGAMKGFNDETKGSVYYADLMAKGATLAATDVSQLGEALSGTAANAKTYGQSADSMTLALLRLAEQGEVGSAASTALSAAMKNLYAPTDQAKNLLSQLGVQAFDPTSGAARDFNDVVNELNVALSGYTDQQRTAYAQTIFGIQGFDAYNKMVVTSTEKQEEWAAALEASGGEAAKQYETMTDNLVGDIDKWSSALDGFKIALSDEVTPSIRKFVQFGATSLGEVTAAFEEGGLTGAMDALGGILSDGLGMIIEMLPTAIDAGMRLLSALGQGLLDNSPMIIEAAVQIVTMLGDGILDSLPVLDGAAVEIVASLATDIGGMLPDLIPAVVETVVLVAGTLVENLPLFLDAGMQLIGGLVDGIVGAAPMLIGQMPRLIDQILGFLTESLPAILEQGSAILLSLTDGILGAVPMLAGMLPVVITSICGFVAENLPTILEQGVQILTTLATGIIGALPELVGQMPAIVTGVVGALSENFPSIVSTGVALILELGFGIISAIPQLVAQLPAIGVAILGAFGEIPGMVLGVGKSIVEGLWSGISSMGSWVAEKVKGFASGIVDGIKGFLGIHSPSTVFAEIGDNMALGLGKGFGSSMEAVTEDIKGAIPTSLDGPEIGTAVADSVYKVRPIVEDINAPSVSDIYYSVNPLVEDFNPAGYEQYAHSEGGAGGYFEQVGGSGNSGAAGNGENAGGVTFSFAPTLPPIQITIEGSADRDALEEMRVRIMAEFDAKFRVAVEEFQEEMLQWAVAKNQYAY